MDKRKATVIYNKMRDRRALECYICHKLVNRNDPFTLVRTKRKTEYLIHDECFSKSR